ncbi:MAG TPA: tannase/feruloyl esterase family alpha/beta hydrolase, partial [Streptosporangiaceae bacterium]|nr:tannase/feruloyl esterase family alpha/beta hydrolase [Streptosporangiaceae bacterium]
ASAQATAHERALASSVTNVPTLSSQDGSDMANLPVIPAGMSCAQLAKTTSVAGQAISITQYQTASAAPGSPQYCAVTGHINTYIGFEILLPVSTWRQRYLQVGCGGLCGSISISPAETTGYKPLADGDFVLAAEDDGHNGNGIGWYSNAQQRVDFAYLSYHDVALVAKGLADKFYGTAPRYSYFDGCSQGGNEALSEIQRYPTDFNGVLAGAPASITTELNSVLHEYTFEANYSTPGYSGSTILDQPEATILLNAAIKACDPKAGIILDNQACQEKFSLNSVECSAKLKTNCLTAAQVAVVRKVLTGPVDAQDQLLYPGGYSLSSAYLWSNPTSVNLPLTPGGTVTPATFITEYLQYLTFETDIGATAVTSEPFTQSYFEQIEKLAPFWDATDPDLQAFDQAGGKLLLWQGEADFSIPFITSDAYYQAVVQAMGGLAATQQFARYYALPSVGHCGGNGPDTYNGLGAVVSWTERGIAPNALVATQYAPTAVASGPPPAPPASDLTDVVPALGQPAVTAEVRQINIYPYPELPAYNGYGNVDDASSYYGKVSWALQQPIQWLGKFDSTKIWCNSQGESCRETSGTQW